MLSQQKDLNDLFIKGIEQARRESRHILVSQCRSVPTCSPLSFFMAGEAQMKGERIYWSTPQQQLTIVGLGTAFSIEQQAGHAFGEVERLWNQLLDCSIIERPTQARGTGPLLLGGFSFDPEHVKTALWRDFPDTMMTLPKFLLTSDGHETWLTTNSVMGAADDPYEMIDHIQREEQSLWSNVRIHDRAYASAADMNDTLSNEANHDMHEVNLEAWKKAVGLMAEEVGQGHLEKVVLAREVQVMLNQSEERTSILKCLQDEQPDSYIFAVESGDHCFLGASPELLVKRDGQHISSSCLAGSIARGEHTGDDDLLGKYLLNDTKNVMEHDLVVRVIREAMQKYCRNVHVPSTPQLYKTRHIQHLYTPVWGEIRENISLLSFVKELSPTPAMGGVPRDLAMQRIRQVEDLDRGWYAAPLGWLDFRGDGEFAVAIRAGLINDTKASLFAGCGIMADSTPQNEYEETSMKLQPMLSALRGRTL